MTEDFPLGGGNGGAGRAPGQPNLMAVHPNVVREVLIERLFSDVLERDNHATLPDEVAAELDRAFEVILGESRARKASLAAETLGKRLARLGYLTRDVERERFPTARGSAPELADGLRERLEATGGDRLETAVSLAGELARREPMERVDPDDERAASWRVPGPGGHVRHYLAIHSAAAELDQVSEAHQLPMGFSRKGELKRCWMYGFFLRCCEEAFPAGAAPPEG
ncbi:MAG: hypothetical protein M3N16_08770 [Actinomycetota bacterium]|nr:hypothetical protein [Actinomycetota bacterium]